MVYDGNQGQDDRYIRLRRHNIHLSRWPDHAITATLCFDRSLMAENGGHLPNKSPCDGQPVR